jgi:sugar phosphate isomerase/epimerase
MSEITRRDFVQLSTTAIAGFSLGGIAGCSMKPEKYTPLGVQLYSVRNELAEDFEGTVARLAAMGYEGLEFADYFGMAGEEIKEILDKYDLRCCGSHVRMDVLRGDDFEETVAFNKAMGNNYFIIRWIPEEERETREMFLETIKGYNEIAARLESHGMRLGYHNHDYIFQKFGDEYLWDILAENTDESFILQLDMGHSALMGESPVELIRRHPGRTASIHAKAYSTADEEAVIGEDELDWEGIIEASEEVGGIEWYILEYEIENVPPLEALEASINNFRELQES